MLEVALVRALSTWSTSVAGKRQIERREQTFVQKTSIEATQSRERKRKGVWCAER